MRPCIASFVLALTMPLPLARPILMPRPYSPTPTGFPGFVHVLRTYPEKLTIYLKGFLGLLARWHVHGDCGGNCTGLHIALCHRNSGCNSTASYKNTRLRGRYKLLHLLGHGRVQPSRQPRRRLIWLSCQCLYLCRCTGRRHWRIDTTLQTHFVVINNIHYRLATHLSQGSQGMVPQQYLCHCTNHRYVQCQVQCAGCLSTTTGSRRASVHWFLLTRCVVLIFLVQCLCVISRARHC